MKKLWPVLIVVILLFIGCKEKPQLKNNVDWTTYRKAYAWLGKQQDSAFYYFNQVTVHSKDSLQIAMAYSSMANIQYQAGDFYGSQESVLSSLRFLNEHKNAHFYYLAGDYNNLGLVRAELGDNDGAITYYLRNLEFATDKTLIDLTWNNIAYAYQQKKDFKKAISIYTRLLSDHQRHDADYARALTNLATANWQADPGYNPVPALLSALKIRRQKNDQWGLNSSYAHLADYYTATQPDSARLYARLMYKVSSALGSPDDRLQALRKLAGLYSGYKGKLYFRVYNELNDSLQTARNAAKNQFALIRYHVEKAKTENLLLQKENAEKKYQLIRQRVLWYGSLTAFFLIGGFAVLWYRKRRKEQALEKQKAIAETSRKASKKVHDTLANDAYRIMKTVQRDLVPNRDWLVYQIYDLYIRSRDIAHELAEKQQKDYPEKISELLRSFGDDQTRVLVTGNNHQFWERISVANQFEVKYILQELMVNMRKHSQASNVTIRFENLGDQCRITYYDNGMGIAKSSLPGNGLTNTENRIKEMGGKITFDSENSDGLLITITLPTTK